MEANGRTLCPISTTRGASFQEVVQGVPSAQEIKAYKLGKKRWSYNQIEVVLMEKDGKRELHSKQAMHGVPAVPELGDCGGISYQITLTNDEVVTLSAYLVYDTRIGDEMNHMMNKDGLYDWILVNRGECKRGCEGPVMRAIQRFGKMGKRSGSNCNTPKSPASTGGRLDRTNSNMKDSRYMYLSLDEAVTHVGCRCFRLVCGAFDVNGSLIGTSVSQPIRVLANNDVPTGAAHIEMFMEVDSSWPGWESSFTPVQLFPPISPAGGDFARKESFDSLPTPKRLSARLRKAASSGQKRFSSMMDDIEDEKSQHTIRRTQSMKKGKVEDYSHLRHTINLTAHAQNTTSPFAQWQSQTNNQQCVENSLAHWLQELNHDLQQQQQEQQLQYQQQQRGNVHACGNLASMERFYVPTLPQNKIPAVNNLVQAGEPTTSRQSGPTDDPVAAFVQLMMSQSPPTDNVPILEIPHLNAQVDHPQSHHTELYPSTRPLDIRQDNGNFENSHLFQFKGSDPNEMPPPLATPTDSAMESLLCGINASTSLLDMF
jgi:hypothetical protein